MRAISKYKPGGGGGGGCLYLEKLIFGILWYSNNTIRPNELVLSFKKRNTLLSVGIVFVKHTLKFRKYVKIFQIIKTLFVMYHEHLKVTTNSIFSLVCPFQEPVMLSTTHLMLLISLPQTKPSTFEMIFPSHPDIALNQPVSPQCLRLVLLSPKDFHNLPKSPDKSSRTSSMDDLSHSSFTPFDLLVGEAWVQIICYQKHSLPFGYITKL